MTIPRDSIMSWMNAIGLVLTALPDGYWTLLNTRIIETLQNPALMNPHPGSKPFQMFNFSGSHQVIGEQHCGYLLALCHAIWHHASIGQLSSIPQFIREVLKPLIKTEDQLLFVCHLVGPFLRRFHIERTRCLLELTVELYEILQAVDKSVEHLRYMDAITDFLYHIKYMFVGNGVKNEVEKVIPTLRPALQLRLRFISHHFKEEAPNPT
ncbi:hypothetical protein NP493_478g01047 [Ridgeia piscesae]|uniref:Mediator of RNA polymerase II transcription subunit 23 n=1 Tax=Ridgeia piscesae TaxID=27915 RepID=A0AAD9KYC0_RIDPI|nr:hypothetical protein NP493_478g01047 [Ridgeia piscesae]